MFKKYVLYFNIFVVILCQLPLCAANLQYDNLVIERIDIVMMNIPEGKTYDTLPISTRLKSQPGELFSQSAFDLDLKHLIEKVDRVEPIFDVHQDKIVITLKVWPKPKIRKILWQGCTKIPESTLKGELEIKPGKLFDRRAFNQAFHKLKDYYIKQGFFEAELNYNVDLVPGSNAVDITINVNEGRAGKIKEIVYVNFTDKEIAELNELIATKTYFFLTSWLTGTGIYHEEAVQQDEFAILNYLQNEGYADAHVDIQVEELSNQNRIIVKITADKGQRYRIGRISFQGNTLFENNLIWEGFVIQEGDWYSPEKVRETTDRLTHLYGRFGYIDTIVDYEPTLSETGCVYDINFTIEEGPQYHVGLIKVFGNCTTQTRVILNEILLVPGEVFNIQKLKRTESRLVNIGFFKTVNVYAVKSEGPSGLGEHYRDVHIEVEEAPTGHVGAFFGFSTAEELFGGFTLTETNFNYRGLGCLKECGFAGLRGGGEYAYFTATIGAKSRSYVLSWNKPFVCDTPWAVGFDLDNSSNRYISNDYDFKSTGLRVHADYPINVFLRTGCYYRLKYTDINISDHEEKKAEEIVNDPNESKHERRLSEHLLEEQKNSGLISAVGIKLIYDSTNNPACPTEGLKSRFEAECAGVGGKFLFLGLAYVNTYFFQLPNDTEGVWKLRGNCRFLQPYGHTTPNTIPLDERLFLGGEDFVRGFRPFRLGPKYPGDDPRGGMSTQFLSLEYSFNVTNWFQAFCFVDSGHISMKQWHFGKFYTSVGYGARLSIVPSMPPLTIGWGIPINPKDRTDVKRFFLSLGGNF